MAKWSRNDANHDAVADAYRRLGYRVKSTSMVGEGFPDLVVQNDHETKLVEVKTDKGKLRKKQEVFMAKGWKVEVVRSVEDVR